MGAPFLTPGDLVPLAPERLAPGVVRTPLLTPSACARILREADARGAGAAARPPNSMHESGAILESLGMESLVDELIAGPLGALVAERFAAFGGDTLDHHHSYLVDYGRDGDEDLGFHVDDSEVTLNLCLGETFSGAELVMMGLRCERHRQDAVRPGEEFEVEHEPGSCVLHAGRHRHRVDPILRGRRRNLIAWLRSGAVRRDPPADCPPWCGARA